MESLFQHPDSEKFFIEYYDLLMTEGDRGCILLGVSMLDEQLKIFFEKILPSNTSNKKRKEIFDGRGVFGSLSSKLDIAYACHLLPSDLIDCIQKLRKLRNDLAHQVNPFSIKENLEAIVQVFTLLNGNVMAGLAQLSGEIIYGTYFKKLMDIEHPFESGKRFFESEHEAYAYIENNPNISNVLTDQRIKCMFAIGISILAAWIIIHREKAINRLLKI